MCSLVATAFHNAGVEYEHIKDYSSSLRVLKSIRSPTRGSCQAVISSEEC